MTKVKRCSQCGKEVSQGGSFCPFCGNIINENVKSESNNIYKSQKKHVEKGSGFSAYSDYSVDELRSARFANSNMVMCMEKNIGKNHQCCCGQVYSNKNNKCPLCGKERRDK